MAKRATVKPQLQEIAARPGVTTAWDKITVNRWKPDTCNYGRWDRCVVEQWFDDEAKPRVISFVRVVERCSVHIATGLALFSVLYGENTRKNAMLGVVANALSLDSESVSSRAFWSFDSIRIGSTDERVLRLALKGTTGPQRTSIQSSADTRFGAGAVVIEAA